MKGDHVGEFEELVLLALHGLRGEAYGVAIQQLLEKETHRSVSLGAVYAALERLEGKGLARSTSAPGTPMRGGRSRRLFELTADGLRSLDAMRRVRERLYGIARLRPIKGRT
ncbi:MAG TPA: PadR family transcriptional regulator [Vicinamibacterales bacterium]|jgi:DNA-binding PadR family transcriptional regulator|nr:PadR family transcriptional regulator [Vicinamibacterales bacterium]